MTVSSKEGVDLLYSKIANKITEYFINKDIIKLKERAIYSYGFEVLLSTIIYVIIFLALSIITNELIPSLIFGLAFFILRSISGGYHANTYKVCHLLSFLNHFLFIVLLKLLPVVARMPLSVIFIVASIVIILLLSPVDHPNKPFIKDEKRRFRIYSCIYCSVLTLIILSYICLFANSYKHMLSFSIGTVSAALSLLSAKIKQKKEKNSL